jgi:hypothetical protein
VNTVCCCKADVIDSRSSSPTPPPASMPAKQRKMPILRGPSRKFKICGCDAVSFKSTGPVTLFNRLECLQSLLSRYQMAGASRRAPSLVRIPGGCSGGVRQSAQLRSPWIGPMRTHRAWWQGRRPQARKDRSLTRRTPICCTRTQHATWGWAVQDSCAAIEKNERRRKAEGLAPAPRNRDELGTAFTFRCSVNCIQDTWGEVELSRISLRASRCRRC